MQTTQYKETKIGKIPTDWEVKKLGELGNVFTGNTPPTKDINNYGDEYLFVSPSDLGNNKYIENTGKKLSPKGFKISRQFPKYSILYTCIGSTIGKIGISTESLTSNQQINAIVTFENYNHEFVYYQLEKNTPKIRLLAGEQAVPLINKTEFENIQIPIPPLPEQQKIAEVLSTWDEAIQQTQKLITALEKRNKGLAFALLTGKKRLKGFEEKWNKVKMNCLFEEIRETNDEDKDHSILTISAKKGFVSQEDKFDRVIAGDSLIKYTLLRKGDFAYNKGNSKSYEYGCIFLLENYISALVPFVYICFRQKKELSSNFYKFWFSYHGLDHQLRKIITSGARGDGLLNVNKKDFFNLFIVQPSLKEQNVIAEVLNTADAELKQQKQKLAALQLEKKGLMQQLLTGKVRTI